MRRKEKKNPDMQGDKPRFSLPGRTICVHCVKKHLTPEEIEKAEVKHYIYPHYCRECFVYLTEYECFDCCR